MFLSEFEALTIASSLAMYLSAMNVSIAQIMGNTAVIEKTVPGSLVKNAYAIQHWNAMKTIVLKIHSLIWNILWWYMKMVKNVIMSVAIDSTRYGVYSVYFTVYSAV